MTYGNVPMIIPCLATGYLLTVYLLLLLAQRQVKNPETRDISTPKEEGLGQLSATSDR
ncbi:hypothetical protein Chro_0648 [Chroococcidiopsis thermalis PCC 7203]|jgi:hypothetical protein|uniref:Uncharacterized protein n=1 Tax=Chroococcidiopsis thermalis (strain PCC 7203) TaxID=251229 RepID=K9TW19_CHRTP|nr:hypothetical protein Chro_0648 [Chroococcidiopsis thermalis PCC 7203]